MALDPLVLTGRRILVVEDDYLLARFLADMLKEAGAEVLGPVGWLDHAIAWIECAGEALDGAILDVNLHGRSSYPIADALIARSVGFVFTTGYGANVLDGKYRSYPRYEKPIHREALIAALAAA